MLSFMLESGVAAWHVMFHIPESEKVNVKTCGGSRNSERGGEFANKLIFFF